MYDPSETHSTAEHYSPHDLLPQPEPRTVSPPLGWFYNNVAKHLIRDTVRIMNNGLHIDLDKVEALETVLDEQLAKVTADLASNTLITQFQTIQHKRLVGEYVEDRKSKLRMVAYYLKPFKHSDMVHRSYFMHLFAEQQNIPLPTELLTGAPISKWSANLVKTFSTTRPVLQRLLDGSLSHPLTASAMQLLAEHKAAIYNEKYLEAIKSPQVLIPAFNPASSVQKQALFKWLGLESDKTSKDTGLPSWDRDEVERVNKTSDNPDIVHFTQCFIDHSYAAIVRNNFIEAFYRYTVNDRLHGQYKLLGAKSGRYTSSQPNMLNSPSTGSVFAKPIKSCFTAAPGKLIAAIDYSGLEDRVMASLSRDTNKCAIFLEDLDGHSLSAAYYFPDKIPAMVGPYTDNKQAAILLKSLVDSGDKIAKAIRQDAKPVSLTTKRLHTVMYVE